MRRSSGFIQLANEEYINPMAQKLTNRVQRIRIQTKQYPLLNT
jgi:hypothetical protein